MQNSGRTYDAVALIERAVVASARHMAQFFAQARTIEHEYKSDDSIVMNLDLQSQAIMLDILGTMLPIVAEESPESHQLVADCADFFLVDPLDGTASAKRFQGIKGGQVGFGPLAGVVLGGKLVGASFVSLPLSSLFTAIHGEGVRRQMLNLESEEPPLPFLQRQALTPAIPAKLRECGVLFFPGSRGEVPLVERLRTGNVVENMYRFGGFASDCARLAAGYEQIQIQFSVKAWDFPATLFAREVGLQILCDPKGTKTYFDEWKIALENPIISCPPALLEKLLKALSLEG